jgi:hypothetical protein
MNSGVASDGARIGAWREVLAAKFRFFLRLVGPCLFSLAIFLPQITISYPDGTIRLEPGSQTSYRLIYLDDLRDSVIHRGLPAAGIAFASVAISLWYFRRPRSAWPAGFLAATALMAILLIVGFVGRRLVMSDHGMPAYGAYLALTGGGLMLGTSLLLLQNLWRAAQPRLRSVRASKWRSHAIAGVILAGVTLFLLGHFTPFFVARGGATSGLLINVTYYSWEYEFWKVILPGGIGLMAAAGALTLSSNKIMGATRGVLFAAGLLATLTFVSTLGSVLLYAPFWTPGPGTYLGLAGGALILGGATAASVLESPSTERG